MDILFESIKFGNLELPNRFIRSATWEGLAATDGKVTAELICLIQTLASARVGLIVTGHAYVSPEGQASPWQLGVYGDHLIPGLAEMVDAVHSLDGKIVLQLAHAGVFARTSLTGKPALAVSPGDSFAPDDCRVMEPADIENLIEAFASAAGRAVEAGFDGVQLHAAHGYLLNQFLSPLFNRRKDEYGGSLENRLLVCRRIIKAIAEKTGPDFPVLVKMNCNDLADGGLSPEQAVQVASMFEEAGIAAIEISGGLPRGGGLSPTWTGIDSPEKEAYFRSEAVLLRQKIRVPIVLVGGIRSYEVACMIVEDNIADCIALSRPLICEPGLIERWYNGDRRPSLCCSDNLCFRPGLAGKGIQCVTLKKKRRHGRL